MIDKECLSCKRYYSGSCNGIEDRKRETITIENSCSGYLKTEQERIGKCVKRNYYWCKTFRNVWIIKCYTEEEAKMYRSRCYSDMKLIG